MQVYEYGIDPPTLRLGSALAPLLCCVDKHSVTAWLRSACVKGKAIRFISSPLSALNNRHILFFHLLQWKESHSVLYSVPVWLSWLTLIEFTQQLSFFSISPSPVGPLINFINCWVCSSMELYFWAFLGAINQAVNFADEENHVNLF